jgi:hypothetical protein
MTNGGHGMPIAKNGKQLFMGGKHVELSDYVLFVESYRYTDKPEK